MTSYVRAALLALAVASAACATSITPKPTGESKADPALQRAATRAVLTADATALPPCASGLIVHMEVVTPPDTADSKSPWTERWLVEHCGERLAYLLTFTPGPGGTTFRVRSER
jgi:hypothetical protein